MTSAVAVNVVVYACTATVAVNSCRATGKNTHANTNKSNKALNVQYTQSKEIILLYIN